MLDARAVKSFRCLDSERPIDSSYTCISLIYLNSTGIWNCFGTAIKSRIRDLVTAPDDADADGSDSLAQLCLWIKYKAIAISNIVRYI